MFDKFKYPWNKSKKADDPGAEDEVYAGPEFFNKPGPMECVYAGPEYFAGKQSTAGISIEDAERLRNSNEQPEIDVADGVICPSCGIKRPADAPFCFNCGAKMPQEEA